MCETNSRMSVCKLQQLHDVTAKRERQIQPKARSGTKIELKFKELDRIQIYFQYSLDRPLKNGDFDVAQLIKGNDCLIITINSYLARKMIEAPFRKKKVCTFSKRATHAHTHTHRHTHTTPPCRNWFSFQCRMPPRCSERKILRERER